MPESSNIYAALGRQPPPPAPAPNYAARESISLSYDAAYANYQQQLAAYRNKGKGGGNGFSLGGAFIGGSFAGPIGGFLGGILGGKKKKKKPRAPLEVRLTDKYLAEGRSLLNAQEYLGPRAVALQAKRNADYSDLQYDNFAANAPRYVEALTTADPYQAYLRKLLNETATDDLEGGLSSSVQREIQQGSRAAWSQRGLYNTGPSAIAELYALGDRGYQQRNNSITNALNVGTFNQRVIGDPFLAVTGRSSVPNVPDYTPFTNPIAHDTYSMLESLDLNNLISKRNAASAKDAANKQLIGSIAGAALGAGSKVAGGF